MRRGPMSHSAVNTTEQKPDALIALARLLGRQAAAEFVGGAQPTCALGTGTAIASNKSVILTSTST